MDQFKCGGSPVAGWAYSFGSVQGVTMLAEGGLSNSWAEIIVGGWWWL